MLEHSLDLLEPPITKTHRLLSAQCEFSRRDLRAPLERVKTNQGGSKGTAGGKGGRSAAGKKNPTPPWSSTFVGRIASLGRRRHHGKVDQRNTCPFNVQMVIHDASRTLAVSVWGTLAIRAHAQLQVGDIVCIRHSGQLRRYNNHLELPANSSNPTTLIYKEDALSLSAFSAAEQLARWPAFPLPTAADADLADVAGAVGPVAAGVAAAGAADAAGAGAGAAPSSALAGGLAAAEDEPIVLAGTPVRVAGGLTKLGVLRRVGGSAEEHVVSVAGVVTFAGPVEDIAMQHPHADAVSVTAFRWIMIRDDSMPGVPRLANRQRAAASGQISGGHSGGGGSGGRGRSAGTETTGGAKTRETAQRRRRVGGTDVLVGLLRNSQDEPLSDLAPGQVVFLSDVRKACATSGQG